VIQELRELSEELMTLKRDYGITLKENPSLIWQGIGDGTFWPIWDERVRAHSGDREDEL
jgi:hypothetical protein